MLAQSCILIAIGYSTGIASGANNPSMNYGGQCLDGLKMVVRIGQFDPPTAGVCMHESYQRKYILS